ncbi:MAG: calcium-binding protein, partial [Shinella sp.]
DDQISGGGTLLGFTGDDTITGGARADIIDGGEGKDTMAGGAGNDKYYVDNARDVIHELSDEGIDRVQSEVSYKLPDNVENLFLSGSTAINGTGNDGSNGLYGNSAANQLNGRAGADLMIGRGGDDVYIVEDTGDIVKEQASEGIDLVYALVSYTLTDDVENLVLKTANSLNGNGNALDNEISGNAGANILSGWRGSDTLKGAAGNDTLIGGLGADKLYGGSGADTFLFQSHKQSDMLERDIIYDFSHAQGDKIDLSAIDASVSVSGNQVFAFIGANAFSNKAGELRAIIKNGETFIHGDMNGDSTIDFSVKLATAVNLTSSDFIL